MKYQVRIEVLGGVAHVVECPPEVEVTITDFDNIEAEPFDTSCEVCGAPDRWPLCASCERLEEGLSHYGTI